MTKQERKASTERMEAAKAATWVAVNANRCPNCGNTLYNNTALAGWWQCNGFAAVGFRQRGHESDAKCHWQGFTC
jgi:hypothetical protein